MVRFECQDQVAFEREIVSMKAVSEACAMQCYCLQKFIEVGENMTLSFVFVL